MNDLVIPLAVALVSGTITGVLSSLGTVAALRVHIEYLRESVHRHDERLRVMEREVSGLTSELERGRTSLADPLNSPLRSPF